MSLTDRDYRAGHMRRQGTGWIVVREHPHDPGAWHESCERPYQYAVEDVRMLRAAARAKITAKACDQCGRPMTRSEWTRGQGLCRACRD